MRYHALPDFAVGQVARQAEPLTVRSMVTASPGLIFVTIEVEVEVPDRMFTPVHAAVPVVVPDESVDPATALSTPVAA